MMVLDALILLLKEQDPTLSFRRSCREGVCGSDGLNMNGKNGLACITPLSELKANKIVLRPLPGLPVIRDLIIDMSQFYNQYEKIKPYLINDAQQPARENLQSIEERAISSMVFMNVFYVHVVQRLVHRFWWNPDKFIGPAGLLHAYRFLIDSRDTATDERLDGLQDAYSVFRCHGIMNCVDVCPKGLNPTKAIGHIKSMLLKRAV